MALLTLFPGNQAAHHSVSMSPTSLRKEFFPNVSSNPGIRVSSVSKFGFGCNEFSGGMQTFSQARKTFFAFGTRNDSNV
jgi:hypothetical protein